MTKTKKMTKREMFTKVLSFSEVQADPEIVKGIEHEIELLDRKNSPERKMSKNALENISLKAEIMEILTKEPDRLFSVAEIQKAMTNEFSNQRVTNLLTKLKDEGKITRTEAKRKPFYQLTK